MPVRKALRAMARKFPRAAWVYRNLVWRIRLDKSQFGEQRLLADNLPPTGLFLEIGAFQPVMFSNTWDLEAHGWRGVAVDANPDYAFAWRLFRPRTPFWNCAVTSTTQSQVILYRTDPRFGAVSSLQRSHVEKWSVPEGLSIDSVTVPTRTVSELIDHFIAAYQRPPDFVQFDCEGMDIELMQALLSTVPFERLPRYLMIEKLEGSQDVQSLDDVYLPVGIAGISQLFRKRV